MPSTDIPVFATSNLSSCESYLFLNHPTAFIPLTSEEPDHTQDFPTGSSPPTQVHHHEEHASFPASTTMQREKSSTSTAASTSISSTSPQSTRATPHSVEEEDSYLGGGAVRHPFHSHNHTLIAPPTTTTTTTTPTTHQQQQQQQQQHASDLAQLAALSRQTKLRRGGQAQIYQHLLQHSPRRESMNSLELEKQRQEWNHDVMAWWPLPLEVMEREWSEEFYD